MTDYSPILVAGTRPEIIKLAPIYLQLRRVGLKPVLLLTNQQKELVNELLPWFHMTDAIHLPELTEDSVAGKFWQIFKNISQYLESHNEYNWIFAQGDTTSVVATAMSSFLLAKKFVHVEAGLRCDTPWIPFPEEGNRRIVSQISTLNFAPTSRAARNLLNAGIQSESIHVVGNTGIDALNWSIGQLSRTKWEIKEIRNSTRKKILVTMHRRESIGTPMIEVCQAVKYLAKSFDIEIIWPQHTNPHVSKIIYEELQNVPNVSLISPLNYPSLVQMMQSSYFILSDSGGLQEEAPALGKPILVLRDESERQELIEAKGGLLVGTNFQKIVQNASKLITDANFYESMSLRASPFGDGKSAEKIVDLYLKTSRSD